MKKFLTNIAVFFSIPAMIVVVLGFLYIKSDPAQDFKSYKNYSWKYTFESLGDLATKKLLHSPKPYNSFIFGSSRAVSIYACYLQKKIPGSRFFHYANWRETIGGIYAKMRLLDSLGYPLDNVFIYLDTDNSFSNYGRPKPNDHYLLNDENRYLYYYNHFRFLFADANAAKILLGYYVPDEPNATSDLITNDPLHVCTDRVVNNYGDTGYESSDSSEISSLIKSGAFYNRPGVQTFTDRQIFSYSQDVLQKMKALFIKHKTNYYIVITPLYDQQKLNADDMGILQNLFGKNLYDFSGRNAFTENKYNYRADLIHFRPYITKQIIDSIVKPPSLR